jgi:hypothetical protein
VWNNVKVLNRSLPWILVGVSGLHTGTPLFAQGTIAFFRPAQPIPVVYTSFPGSFGFDVNGDGIADYHFNLADGLGVSVDPLGSNRQVAVPAIPPNLGSDLDPLPAGFQIGSSLAPTYTWVSASSPGLAGHSLISSVANIDGNVVTSGLFSGQTAYMGIEFMIGQDVHYGWVLIESPGGTAGGYIHEWAYETQANTSILAGQVPEPSTAALIFAFGAAFWLRQHHRKQ